MSKTLHWLRSTLAHFNKGGDEQREWGISRNQIPPRLPLLKGGMVRALLCFVLTIFCGLQIAIADTPQLPPNLQWQTNDTDPIFADLHAKRGGRFRTYTMEFPSTLRIVGPDSNNQFTSFLQSNILSLVGRHPNTLNPIPELATSWAFDPDGKTIYFKLDHDARWSDGVPVTADDYLFTLEFMRSKFIVDPFSNDYYTNIIASVIKFDDYTIAVRGVTAKPDLELLFGLAISPTPRHFHKLNEHWVDDYNWRIEPNTGAYQISEIKKGKYIEFKRKADWWGNDKRFFQYRFNPDYLRIKLIRDLNMQYNYFAKGELDVADSDLFKIPRFWYKRAQGEPYEKGYIGKIQFYNDVPRVPFGMYLNEDDPLLADRNTRLGLAYAINFEKLIKTILRGDYDRLQNTSEGYGDYTNPNVRARPYDLEQADHYFKQAGWTKRGPDGIRIKDDQRLSVRVTYVSPEQTSYLVLLKEEAYKAGVELSLQQLDASTWGRQLGEKKHQIVWMGFGIGGLAPEYWQQYHSDNAHKPQTNNVTNTDNKAIDAKINAYRAATDKPSRVKLAHEIEQLLYEQGGFIPGYKKPFFREAFWRWIKLPPAYGTRISDSLFGTGAGAGGLFWIDEDEKAKVQKARILSEKFPPINILDETWRVKPQ